MYSIVSFLIAFFAAAGAIPLCKNISRKLVRSSADASADSPPSLAGSGMLAGILIAVFYVVLDPVKAISGFFTVMSAPQGGALLIALALVTPVAAFALGRPQGNAPALTSWLTLVQLIFLVGLGVLVTAGSESWVAHQQFKSIAVPTMGALMAVLIYLCRTPWRAKAIISIGAVTRVSLGLLVAWGALVVGGALARAHDPMPVIWILAVPVFELVYRCLVARSPYAESLPPHVPVSILVSCVMAGGIGVVVWHWRMAGIWSEVALLPAMFAYLLAPRFIFHRGRAQQKTAMVGSPSHVAR